MAVLAPPASETCFRSTKLVFSVIEESAAVALLDCILEQASMPSAAVVDRVSDAARRGRWHRWTSLTT